MQPYEQLEKKWAEFCSLDPEGMVACNSGTAALHLAFESPGSLDYGLCPSFSMVACPRAMSMANMEVEFVDVGKEGVTTKDSYYYTTADLYEASLLVHTYGRKADHKVRTDTYVVEDLAEAHGLPVGSNTDAACWSFYKNKLVAGEEGGAVWFADNELAKVARQLRSLGLNPEHDFSAIPNGMNYRLSNCHADLILADLKNYKQNFEKRRDLESLYDKYLPFGRGRTRPIVPWVYDLILPYGIFPKDVVPALNQKGFAARYGFFCNHLQPEYKHLHSRCPASLWHQMRLIYLPLTPTLTEKDVELCCVELARLCKV